MIFDKHANLKYKYGNRHFWCRGYYVDTVGRYEGAIKEYIRNQLQEDIAQDTLNFKEYTDPFTGEPDGSKSRIFLRYNLRDGETNTRCIFTNS